MLFAACQAGQLLVVERGRVRNTMGAVWGEWLEQNFAGSRVTAQKYIRLAELVSDEHALAGSSLRQMYLRLGIATEPKSRAESVQLKAFPPHVRLANRLLAVLRSPKDFSDTSMVTAYRQDLRALYIKLRAHFESEAPSVISAFPPSKEVHKIAS